MKWSNLKINRCPKCNKDFMKGLVVESNMQPTMFTHPCGFKIGEQRYKEIVSGMVSKGINCTQDDVGAGFGVDDY